MRASSAVRLTAAFSGGQNRGDECGCCDQIDGATLRFSAPARCRSALRSKRPNTFVLQPQRAEVAHSDVANILIHPLAKTHRKGVFKVINRQFLRCTRIRGRPDQKQLLADPGGRVQGQLCGTDEASFDNTEGRRVTLVTCGGVIDRTHCALAKAAYLRYQSDGARWLCPGPWLHVPCAHRSNPYMASYVKRAYVPCPVYFLAFLTLLRGPASRR